MFDLCINNVFQTVFIVLLAGLTVNSEKHSLVHIYVTISKPVELRGIHQFTAMGLLDGKLIHYYDSKEQKTVPKQDWMKEGRNLEYGEKWTEPKHSQQRLKRNMEILMELRRQSDSDIHDLQWMRGCEGEVQPNDQLEFVRGIDMYSYDGYQLFSFDTANQDITDTDRANKIIKYLDVIPEEVTVIYLKYQCIEALSEFMKYAKKQLLEAPEPNVFLFAKKAAEETHVVLTCLATGFYPKDIVLWIRRNGRVLIEKDGLHTSGVRPNEDDTFQRKDHVEILKSDMADYTCEIHHSASGLHVEKKWDHTVGGDSAGVIAAVVVVLLVIAAAAAVGVWWYLKKKRGSTSECVSSPREEMDGHNEGSADSLVLPNSSDSALHTMVELLHGPRPQWTRQNQIDKL